MREVSAECSHGFDKQLGSCVLVETKSYICNIVLEIKKPRRQDDQTPSDVATEVSVLLALMLGHSCD